MGEMAALFSDEVFNIGSDETSAKGRCGVNTSFAIERRLLQAIQHDFKKVPEGWEVSEQLRQPAGIPLSFVRLTALKRLVARLRQEVLFDAGAATPETIVDAWSRHTPAEIIATGRHAVESHGFYFTEAAPGGAAGWHGLWRDIGSGVPAAHRSMLLGGEMSQWTDTYHLRVISTRTGILHWLRFPYVSSKYVNLSF